MNFKRVAALLLAGAMVMTAVPVYAKGDDVTLSVSIWDTNQEPGIKEILADFTEKTGIKTEISVVKWDEYWTMLEAGAQGGSLPDVFWMHSNESHTQDSLLQRSTEDCFLWKNFPVRNSFPQQFPAAALPYFLFSVLP